ncbi:hypothetical protein [Flavobacterium rhamnosiphilum]|uniref:hypothetical protein n=1 Tax=Flavobacterium rhamnosiphilum TaxID=2541724 RepID=UPI00197A8C21|nr:hypothetical protein [Flavobacterium rhamnosiphilum]
MEAPFKNKVAIVTSGSSGIGKSTALAFAKKGAIVNCASVAGHAMTVDGGFAAQYFLSLNIT